MRSLNCVVVKVVYKNGETWLHEKWTVMRGLRLPEMRERRDVTCPEHSLSQYP